jgi:signal peptidase I
LFLMLVFRSAWADWMTVPTGSMNPTILEGDRVLVDKHVYGLRIPWTLVRVTKGRDPQRGEIVVFDSPHDGTSLIKRVIGLPGDVIALDSRGLSINGVHADYSPGDRQRLATLLADTQDRRPEVWRESGVLPAHDILRMPVALRGPREFLAPVQVPTDHYLMLGDNRDNSADSRFVGFVPRRNIVGRSETVAISLDPGNNYRPRGDRFFESLD